MKKKNIKNFTLLELVVAITLIAFSFSFVGMKINTALYSHRCKNNIKKIESYFEFCRKMAQVNQADIYLKL